MATDDKKEYRDTLEILDFTGSGPAVMNKLGKLALKLEDPRLKAGLDGLIATFHSTPEVRTYQKFRLLSWAAVYSAEQGSRRTVSNRIYEVEQYCKAHVASQVPQWQLIASAAGWTPPPTSPA